MEKENNYVEKAAPTIEEAIQLAIAELKLPEEDVDIEILEEGFKGILGIGSKDAVVRVTPVPAPIVKEDITTPVAKIDESELSEEEVNALQLTEATVTELLERMDIYAKVDSYIKDEESSIPSVGIDITGSDLSILIGKKAEILNAFEYITRLIVGKEIGHAIHINIDVEGYRRRRESNLNQLANKMAEQAINTGRTQSLEPMPANERRLVHIALRDHEYVKTSSAGDEPRRKVTIQLK